MNKMHVSSVCDKNSRGGECAELMDMALVGIGAECDPVYVAVAERYCLSGYGGKTVVVGILITFCNEGTARHFVYMLIVPAAVIVIHMNCLLIDDCTTVYGQTGQVVTGEPGEAMPDRYGDSGRASDYRRNSHRRTKSVVPLLHTVKGLTKPCREGWFFSGDIEMAGGADGIVRACVSLFYLRFPVCGNKIESIE